jgi:hypothetical protein
MDISILGAVLASAIGALLPAGRELIPLLIKKGIGKKFFNEHPVGKGIAEAFGIKQAPEGPDQLFKALSSASEKMDGVVRQIQDYTQGREQAVAKLESQLGLMSQQEQELKQRIQGLQNVPLPAAAYFAELVSKSEKRSALRDYILFLLGVLVTAAVGIWLRKIGWA